jgi:hypothetical protein
MIADDPNSTPGIGTPDATVLEEEAFHHAIVAFIERELPVWRDRPKRPPYEDEPRLNQSLCIHLNRSSRHTAFDSIEFTQEPIQSSSRRADIGVMSPGIIMVEGRDYEDFVQLLPIECKRLPTPPDSRRSDCEYVHGLPGHRTGAIERFKHGLHGPSNRRAMIIAYVQAESFIHWRKTINQRLKTLNENGQDNDLWAPAEILTAAPTSFDICKLHSVHRRLQPPGISDQIEAIHLWLEMN